MALQITPNYRKPHKGILYLPDNHLRNVSVKVEKIDHGVIQIVKKLNAVLKELDRVYILWLGIAAPQLGYNLRIIAIKEGFGKYQTMINPEILKQKLILPAISGCYSLRGFYLIQSPYWLKVRYMNLEGKHRIEVFKGGKAILLKQEVDHLNGKLISD